MRNLKKALALVIAMTMVLSTVAFAATFSDVASDSAYAEAIELGVALGFFTGYEDGTFKADGDVTRAEFAAIVTRMLGQAAQADGAKGATKFTDVPADSWASGYINFASNLKIVNGYGDGTFGPEDKVTYEQAVKMLVVALGYEPAVGSAGYPVGYLTIAQQNGMTTSVKGTNGVALNRGQVAQLVANSLDVPLMEQTGFGTYIDYVIQDGSGDTYRKTILSEKLGVVKLRVFVEKSLDLSSTKKAENVAIKVVNAYKSKYADEDYADDFEVGTTDEFAIGKSSIKDLVGATAVVYIAYDENSDDDPVVLYAKRYVSTGDTITIGYEDIDDIDDSGSVIAIKYYETKNSTKTTSFDLAKNASVYVNGYSTDDSDLVINNKPNTSTVDWLEKFYGTATFSLEDTTNSDVDYDTVFITDYATMVVTDNNETAGRVIGDGTVTSIIYNSTNTDNVSTLVDKDGKSVAWSTLKEDDILSVQQVKKGGRTITKAILVTDTVEGVISEEGTEDDEKVYTIGGKEYKVNKTAFEDLGLADLKLEDEGTFYLDILGRITNFDVSSNATHNYGFVLATGLSGSIDDTTQIKMFTYAGEIVTFDVAQKIRLTKYFTDGYDTKTSVESKELASNGAYPVRENDFITFSLNSSGKISKIAYPNTTPADDGKNFNQYASADRGSYDFSDERFKVGGKSIYTNDKTVIMQAPEVDDGKYNEDDYEIMSLSAFTDDVEIEDAIAAYDVDKNGIASAILIRGKVVIDSATNGVAMVVKVSSTKNANGDTIDKATVLQNGNSNDNKAVELLGTDSPAKALSDLKAGSLFAPIVNGKGEVYDYTLLATVNEDNDDVDFNFTSPVTKDKVKYISGEVTARRGAKITLDGEEDYNIPSTANVYVYASKGNNATSKVYAPDIRYNAFTVSSKGDLTDSDGDDLSSVKVFIREYDDKIVDVVFYLFKK